MKDLRDRLYAHSDIPTRGIRPLSIDGYPTAIETLPPMRLPKEDVLNLQMMIALVRRAVAKQKRKLLPAVSTGDFGMPKPPQLPPFPRYGPYE